MKVYVFNPNDVEEALAIKKTHFQEENRDAWREHIRRETGLHFVWFEDEDPPEEFKQLMIKTHEEARETGFWYDGTPFEENDDAETS